MSEQLHMLIKRLDADPSKLRALTPEAERALVASLRAVVDAEEAPAALTPTAAGPTPEWSGDDLLTVEEMAALLKLTPRWVYRHAKTLPFSRKLSRKVLRFSRAGFARWLATRRT